MQRYVLSLRVSVNCVARPYETLVAFHKLLHSLEKFNLKSKKHICFVKLKKIIIRSNDAIVREKRGLARLMRLVSSINKDPDTKDDDLSA